MKKLIATLIALTGITLTSNAMALSCEDSTRIAMNEFQPALASFMEDKLDVLPGDIIAIKELENKTRNSLMNTVTFNSIAAITSPIWLPFYIHDRVKYPGEHCSIMKNVFVAKFMVKYRGQEGRTCKLPLKYKAKGSFLSQISGYNEVKKTVIKTKFAPVCE